MTFIKTLIEWRYPISALLAISSVFGFVAGVVFQNRYDLRFRLTAALAKSSYSDILHDRMTARRLKYNKNNIEKTCPSQENTAVILAVGQSNVANNVVGRYRSFLNVTSFYNGKCFQAVDPLPGATGDRGSIWSRLGDILVLQKKFQNVIIVPVAVGNTTLEMWAPDGMLFPLVQNRLSDLKNASLNPTHIIYQQGESDGKIVDVKLYHSRASSLIRELKKNNAPVFFALTSGCGEKRNVKLRNAQTAVIRETRINKGIDMDAIGPPFRANLCHLNAIGAEKAAKEWARILH